MNFKYFIKKKIAGLRKRAYSFPSFSKYKKNFFNLKKKDVIVRLKKNLKTKLVIPKKFSSRLFHLYYKYRYSNNLINSKLLNYPKIHDLTNIDKNYNKGLNYLNSTNRSYDFINYKHTFYSYSDKIEDRKPKGDVPITRIRFKPGYQRI
jgi:hypothetical protein